MLMLLCFVRNQSSLAIRCDIIKMSTIAQPAARISNMSKASDLGCYWSSENVIRAKLPVEVNIFDSVTLEVTLNLSEIVSCSWVLRENSIPCRMLQNWNSSLVISLDVVRMSEKDAGEYKLLINSDNVSYSAHIELEVKGKPRKPFFIGSHETVSCISEGYPEPTVYWLMCSSPHGRCENKTGIYLFNGTDIYGRHRVMNELKSQFLLDEYIWCCATNAFGTECTQLYTIDLNSEGLLPKIFVKVGEPFIIRCRAKNETFKFGVEWSSNSTDQLSVFEERDYSNSQSHMVKVLFATSLQMKRSNNGIYTCSSTYLPSKSVQVILSDKGFIHLNTSKEAYTIEQSKEFCFHVTFEAYPAARCTWLYRSNHFPCENATEGASTAKFCDHKYMPGEYTFYIENEDVQLNKTFILSLLKKPEVHTASMQDYLSCTASANPLAVWSWKRSRGDLSNCTEDIIDGFSYGLAERMSDAWISRSELYTGNFTGTFWICCCAVNAVGLTCERMPLINTKAIVEQNSHFIPVVTCLCVLSIFFLTALIYNKSQKKNHYQSQLQMIQYIGPSDNEYIYINFSVLEYDLKWEFPRENLEFGKALGSGAFGRVVTATAYGITKSGVSLQVAVKMLKENADGLEKDALMSELKMMTQIGHHENIVNMLGACTTAGPIYLIFEYCRHGDLLNYLRSERETFHKTWTDVVKDHNFSFYNNYTPNQKSSVRRESLRDNGSYIAENRTLVSGNSQQIEDFSFNSEQNNNQEEQIKYENTRFYDEEDLHVLTFEDLLCFSYQVAKGMEFLESKLCIHRDLAARNILITNGKVAKICDFGLARDIENDSNYVVKGNARLPVKWMAPESIFEGIYTIKSDVWSYGILLWEIFSLGINPYPGIQVNAHFYKLLQSGFKMEQPFYATDEIYFLMQSCWAFDSRKRPSFPQLVSFLGYQISNTEALVYQNMDQHNKQDSSSLKHSFKETSSDILLAQEPLI
ncbi:receptor-type tyrosine-protein kinase FLT3 isoform X2 [Xenopus laevis]|nr:receptor-type tyrosine-protein kinase FLT3 isoform X2 [Xenopus laevis]